MEEARYYEKKENNIVHCFLCKHNCRISEGKYGICKVRKNIEGILYSLVYGKIVANNVDPIEKKPLFHVLPGSKSYSISTVGCNFKCLNCQNSDISQPIINNDDPIGRIFSPDQIVDMAIKAGCKSIAYTYTEPTIFFEYAFDVAKIAKEKGLLNIFVTNGYIGEAPLRDIAPYLDAANIDLKSSNKEFYKKICGGNLDKLYDSIKLYHKLGIFLEITTLIIPDYNDSEEDLRGCVKFIKDLDENIPWHISRFHPDYKLINHRSTPVETLLKAKSIAEEEGLKYIYIGNVFDLSENTFCPICNTELVKRSGYTMIKNSIDENNCPKCKSPITGIWK
ncbi:MAG: AmmeMemoRadiSam system radical SAM enzyme [Candidatus Ranarchaeia archaeon]